jgi:transmembrane sensor
MNMAGIPMIRHPKTAAEWDARLRSPECTHDDRQAFEAWLTQSPENASSYDLLQHKIELLCQATASTNADLEAIRARALAGVGDRTTRFSKRLWLPALAASLVALIGVSAFVSERQAGPVATAQGAAPVVVATAVGQRKTVRLSDGSKILLNSLSAVEIDFTPTERTVTLRGGEALFDVAKNPQRPFSVRSDGPTVSAVGTSFSVRRDPARLQVIMLEGKAKVGRGARADDLLIVRGQRLIAQANMAMRVDTVDLSKEFAWLEGRIIFEDEPLSSAVAGMNRYLQSPLRVEDPVLRRIRINGMFRTDRPENFLSALSELYLIRAEPDPSGNGLMLVRR